MASFLERLRAALAGRYEVEREIGRGGMGTVFRGRDPRLKRAVAIKALRPEDYTAVALAHFQQEAQLLANLSHTNIVPVYDTGIAAGIPWYVMELLTGQTLESRLGGGDPGWRALAPDAVGRLGLDLLAALDVAHRHSVVHRDVKPANIIFRRDDAVLTDFGIAKSLAEARSETLRTAQGTQKGTLAFMSPEQLAAEEATPRSDLYSAAVVLHLAYTGRLRTVTDPPDRLDPLVPARAHAVLARALQVSDAARWPDAASFRAAWDAATGPEPAVPAAAPPREPPRPSRGGRRAAAILAAAALVVIGYVVGRPRRPKLPQADVALAPLTTTNTANLALGRDVALLSGLSLLYFPHLRVVDPRAALNCWERAEADTATLPRATCRDATRARFIVDGTVTGRGDSVDVRLNLFDRRDEAHPIPVVSGLAGAPDALTSAVATAVLRALVAQDSTLGPVDSVTITFCGRRVEALAAFSRGEDEFRHDNWLLADQEYQRALTIDPTCALAAWRLSVVRAWRRMPVGVDLRRLYDQQRAALPLVVRALLAARLAPAGPARLSAYRTAVADYPGESYAWLLFGNELWSRGTLAGVPLEAADTALSRAVALDRSAPVYDHIAWLNIRLGHARAARAALDAIPPGPRGDVDLPRLLELGYRLRFIPESAAGDAPAPDMNDIAKAVRFGLTVDVPDGQVRFGQALAAAPGITSDQRADGHEAQAVALMMLGRTRAALVQFDSAAALRGSVDRIEPAEWRLLLEGMGLFTPAEGEVSSARRVIEGLVADPTLGRRAAWDLAVSAFAAGDTAAAGQRLRAFRPRDAQDSLALQALAALQLAARGRLADAATAARPLGWTDADHLRRYPFLRSVMHLRQGAWRAQLGDTAAADSAWLWYDNADAAEWPIGPAQAGDVDWSLATWARLLRARLDPAHGACGAKRAAELWAGADPGYQALVAEARTLAKRCKS